MKMEILEVIDLLEDLIDKAPTIPITGKVLVDREDVLDYLQEMRMVYPGELKKAKWVNEERERILTEAETKAAEMQKNAEEKIVQLIDEHEITQQAYEKANEMVNNAKKTSLEIKEDCDKYANDILGDVEHRLEMLLNKVREDKSYYKK